MPTTTVYPTIEMEPVTIEPEVPAEPTTRIKPGEAIRIGRLQVPLKSTGKLIVKRTNGEVVAACALGAMMIGYGESGGGSYWWPADMPNPVVQYPCCSSQTSPEHLSAVTAHINDTHIAVPKRSQSWTEQRLADWLDMQVAEHK